MYFFKSWMIADVCIVIRSFRFNDLWSFLLYSVSDIWASSEKGFSVAYVEIF